MKQVSLTKTLKNSVVFTRSDFRVDLDGRSCFEGVLSACEIPEKKWDFINAICVYFLGYDSIEREESSLP